VAAINYVGTLLGKPADKWRAMSASDQGRTLVMATRYIDQQGWTGLRTGLAGGTPTTLQWPRSDVTVLDGTGSSVAVDPAIVPPEFVQATFELSTLIAADPTIVTKADTGSNVRRADAGGGVGVEFFNPTSSALGTASPMPTIVMRLLGKFMSVSGGIEGGFGQSGKSSSDFAHCHELDRRVWPF